MKHLVALFLFFLSLPSFSQSYDVVSCGACKGSGKTACYGCMGQGVTTTYVMDYNCYFGRLRFNVAIAVEMAKLLV